MPIQLSSYYLPFIFKETHQKIIYRELWLRSKKSERYFWSNQVRWRISERENKWIDTSIASLKPTGYSKGHPGLSRANIKPFCKLNLRFKQPFNFPLISWMFEGCASLTAGHFLQLSNAPMTLSPFSTCIWTYGQKTLMYLSFMEIFS